MRSYRLCAFLLISSAVSAGFGQTQSLAQSNKQAKASASTNQLDPFTNVNLIEGMKSGLIDAKAVGTGDGRMTISVQNKTNRRLRVILPPGLIASGASGQMGGMGGGGGGATVPPMMGMMEIATLFMTLTGDRDS